MESFISHFIRDAIADHNLTVDEQTLKGNFIDILELEDDAKIQLKAQVCYKSLLKKFSYVLMNFSTMEVSQDVKEYCILIEIQLKDEENQTFFEDSFEWDILNDQNKYFKIKLVLKNSVKGSLRTLNFLKSTLPNSATR